MSFFGTWTSAGSGVFTIRDYILAGHFTDHCAAIRLVAMSRFSPADHLDCIIASESSVTANDAVTTNASNSDNDHRQSHHPHHPHHHQSESPLRRLRYHIATCCNFTSPSQHHRKYLSLVLLLLLLSIFCLVSTSIIDVLSSNGLSNSKYSHSKDKDTAQSVVHSTEEKLARIQLENILQNELSAEYFNGSWASHEQLAWYDTEYNLVLYNSTSKKGKVAISFPYVLSRQLRGLQLSSDLQYILAPSETVELFRYSKLEKLKIYDIANRTMIPLFKDGNFSEAFFQYGLWGPRGSQLLFSYENNLYYKDSANAETVRLSVTGIPGVIFNGHTDWLYEEEVLNANVAAWFSPYGTSLAYLQINDSAVELQTWARYGDYYNISNNQYPSVESIRYPKPGTANPQVSLFMVDLHSVVEHIRVKQIRPPEKIVKGGDFYVSKVAWYDNERLLVAWTGRNQTSSTLVLCDRTSSWSCEEIYTLSADKGWVDGFESGLLSAPDQHAVLVRINKPVKVGSGSTEEYYHVASINVKNRSITYLTDGKFDVIKLIAYSPVSSEVFYASTLVNHPEVQHIIKVSLLEKITAPSPTEQPASVVCLTCYLGNSCRFNEATFNLLATRYVLECKGYEIPRTELRSSATNELLATLETNSRLYAFLREKHIPRYEKLFVRLTDSEADDAIVELILPPNFDEETGRYPLVIELYGAPNTQMVRDKYEMNHWSSHLTTDREYIYARVDVRGSSHQGVRYMHSLYRNIGHLEVDDLIDVVWYLRTNLTYIDPTRVAVWGWSYGGYFSLMSLIREFDNRLFACAIAVAPVSNWMYYDSAYSERYLGVPDSQNLYSYEDSNLLDNALLLKKKKFLIVFGTSDDNVHIQHSLLLIRKLNELNIDYDVQLYPDDNHYLLKSSAHLYRKMTNYLQQQCFQQS